MLTSPPRGFNSLYLDTGNDFRLFFVVSLRGPPPPSSPPPLIQAALENRNKFLESRTQETTSDLFPVTHEVQTILWDSW